MKDDECGRRREQHRALRGKAAIPLDEIMVSRLRSEVNTTQHLGDVKLLCVNKERVRVFHSRLNLWKKVMRSTLSTFRTHTMGRVRRRKSRTA